MEGNRIENKVKKVWISIVLFLFVIVIAVFYKQLTELNKTVDFSNKKIQINFVHWKDYPTSLFDKFEEEHQTIEIKYEKLSEDDYSELIRARLHSGENIDILGIRKSDYSEFVNKGYLLNLSYKKYLGSMEKEAKNAIQNLVFNHQIYGIPFDKVEYGIWYNKSIFRRNKLPLPSDFSSFIKVCDELKAIGITPLSMGAKEAESFYQFMLLEPLFSEDSIYFQEKIENGQILWKNSGIIGALTKVDYFFDKEFIDKKSMFMTTEQAFEELVSGGSAMLIASSESLAFGEVKFETQAGEFEIIPITLQNSHINYIDYTRELLGVYIGSQNQEAVDLFLDFLTQEESVKRCSLYKGSFIPFQGGNLESFQYREKWEVIDQLPSKNISTDFLDYRMKDEFYIIIKKIITDQISVNEAALLLDNKQEYINN